VAQNTLLIKYLNQISYTKFRHQTLIQTRNSCVNNSARLLKNLFPIQNEIVATAETLKGESAIALATSTHPHIHTAKFNVYPGSAMILPSSRGKIMPIISLSSFKGGVAKTTSAICLASLFCSDGATLVIDADPNRSTNFGCKDFRF